MKYLLILCLMVMLSGCLATDPAQWGAPQPVMIERDIYECRQDADAKMAYMAAFGGAIVPLVGMLQHSRNFERCMKARGYQREDR